MQGPALLALRTLGPVASDEASEELLVAVYPGQDEERGKASAAALPKTGR